MRVHLPLRACGEALGRSSWRDDAGTLAGVRHAFLRTIANAVATDILGHGRWRARAVS